MLVDSHCHLNFISFRDDATAVAADFLSSNYALLNVGAQYSTSERAIKLAEKFPRGVYAVIGLHPLHLMEAGEETVIIDGKPQTFKTALEDFDADKYRQLARSSKKIVAFGETGLDYFYFGKFSTAEIASLKIKQEQAFRGFIALAEEFNLPLVIHTRGSVADPTDAYDDILRILRDEIGSGRKVQGVVHCFGGNSEQAKEFLQLGLYLGFTGIITFKKKSEEAQQIVRETPLERILVETDAPFLSPEPYRGARNIPQYVEFVAKKVAQLKDLPYGEVAEATTRNAKKLFGI
ncbi:MAG: TatD family hydrolase [Patescibacteria group bacterium]|jgi:TatD DNase family protein